jgi:cytochrome c553
VASRIMWQLFRAVRTSDVGFSVSPAVPYQWRSAVVLRKWQALEALDLVRLRAEQDTEYDPSEWEDEPADAEAYGSIGEFRLDTDADWEHADSVWGHIGYRNVLDWRENAYILDVMAATIAALRDASKAAARARRERELGFCPTCHGSGRVETGRGNSGPSLDLLCR